MDNISLKLNDDSSVRNGLIKLSDALKSKIIDEIKVSTLNLETSAKRDCPVNFGILRSSIYKNENEDGSFYSSYVGSDMVYAPYVEFGTGGMVSVPVGYEDFAVQFKGQKKVIGMNAQPYLIPNYEIEIKRLIENIKKLLNAKS